MTTYSSHSRGSSHNSHDSLSSSTHASSYQLILDHVFSCPATYELPLRTVFAHNSNHHLASPTASTPTSPIDPPDAHQQATAEFTSALMNQIARLPNQPCSLPTSYICGFLRKCFTEDLLTVDFPQALTGLDYLKDLESKRKREIHAACDRLGIGRASLSDPQALSSLKRNAPNVSKWLDEIELAERKLESLYTNLYVGIRRWIIINELMITPFNRHNCYAMLNTLYPPQQCMVGAPSVTSKLTPSVLSAQRDGFFKWIKTIEKSKDDPRGPRYKLQPLLQQSKRPNSLDENGWPAVFENMDKYLRLAQMQTDTCAEILSRDDIDANGHKRQFSTADWDKRRKQRKADSGVSFGSDRPSTSGSLDQADVNKALPATPPPRIEKQASTLEKLARELRRMKSSRSAVNASFDSAVDLRSGHSRAGSHASNGSGSGQSMSSAPGYSRGSSIRGDSRSRYNEDKPQALANGTRSKSLRKLRSFGDIRSGRSISPFGKKAAPPTPVDEAFDEEEMRRQRELWEAGAGRRR